LDTIDKHPMFRKIDPHTAPLVDECGDDGAARSRRPGDGDLATRQARRAAASLRSQYTSEQFQKLMADNGVVCSMSRSGNVWDNAAMESFFSSLKTERTARKTYRTRDEAKANVFDYIECFYNPKRRHSTIGYLSPVEFEMQAGLA
jgi:transposase InsO family protein